MHQKYFSMDFFHSEHDCKKGAPFDGKKHRQFFKAHSSLYSIKAPSTEGKADKKLFVSFTQLSSRYDKFEFTKRAHSCGNLSALKRDPFIPIFEWVLAASQKEY